MLGHSDTFSLLPTEFEYEIQVIADDDNEEEEEENLAGNGIAASNSTSMRIRHISEINHNLQLGRMPTSLSQIMAADPTNDQQQPSPSYSPERTPSPDNLVPPPSFLLGQATAAAAATQSRKRSLSTDSEDSNIKKSKPASPQNSSQAQEVPLMRPLDPMDPNVMPPIFADNAQQPDAPADSPPLKMEVDDGTPPMDVSQPLDLGDAFRDAAAAAAIKPDPDQPATSSGTAAVVVKPDPDAKTDNADDAQPAAAAVPAPALRECCQFGILCYRRTADHRAEMAHPGDTDYRRPDFPNAPADNPACPYGRQCYRRNPAHFREFRHEPASE